MEIELTLENSEFIEGNDDAIQLTNDRDNSPTTIITLGHKSGYWLYGLEYSFSDLIIVDLVIFYDMPFKYLVLLTHPSNA